MKLYPKRILFIVNPNAGVHKKENYLQQIISVFASYGYETTVCFTKKAGDATTLVVEHAKEGYDRIACMGGDGTLNETLSGAIAANLDQPIGYIPAGSTNDFASGLGISFDLEEAARQIIEGTPHILDMGVFNGRNFVYTASCGLFTKSSYETPQTLKNRLGHFAYVIEGMKDLVPSSRSFRPITMKIDTGDEVFEGNYIFVAICNTYSLGGIMSLDDNDVSLSDGLFELLLIKLPEDISQLNVIIKCLYEQTYDSPYVVMKKIKKATITYPSSENWSLDGERGERQEVNEFKVLNQAVSLIY